jgi:hypothetical protein
MRNDEGGEDRTDVHEDKVKAVDIRVLCRRHSVAEIQQPATDTESEDVESGEHNRRRKTAPKKPEPGGHFAPSYYDCRGIVVGEKPFGRST